jgi:hypothetical protein
MKTNEQAVNETLVNQLSGEYSEFEIQQAAAFVRRNESGLYRFDPRLTQLITTVNGIINA